MKAITEKVSKIRPNGWGQMSQAYYQTFELEPEDVGSLPNYLGHNHRTHQIHYTDVGRHIEVLTDDRGWTCWTFIDGPKAVALQVSGCAGGIE